MALTIPELGIRNAPVMDSVTESALNQGVVHLPDTSLPWSETPERNVYLAGHRLGWPGTGSHLIFYRLNELTGGERITLRARDGTKYDYRVLESFAVWPDEIWVTGRVRGRDLLTLQTCTPIPTFPEAAHRTRGADLGHRIQVLGRGARGAGREGVEAAFVEGADGVPHRSRNAPEVMGDLRRRRKRGRPSHRSSEGVTLVFTYPGWRGGARCAKWERGSSSSTPAR